MFYVRGDERGVFTHLCFDGIGGSNGRSLRWDYTGIKAAVC
jgi:hypothetical protein